jgi:hypothetical protein
VANDFDAEPVGDDGNLSVDVSRRVDGDGTPPPISTSEEVLASASSRSACTVSFNAPPQSRT